MRQRYWWGSILIGMLVLAACEGDRNLRATEFVIITPAPTDQEIEGLEATIVMLETERVQLLETIAAYSTSPAVSPTGFSIATPILPPSITPMPTETLRPSAFPTPRVEIVSVVEQVFERGRMIWFRDTRRVAVLIGDEIDPTVGEWLCFRDNFQESEPEFLVTLQPPPNTTTTSQFPDASLQQPIRGFGKIWREEADIRQGLGWALTSEIEHSAVYEYIAGGILEGQTYIPNVGEYRVRSFYDNAIILLYEAELDSDCPSGRWILRRPS